MQKPPFIDQSFLGRRAVFYVGGKLCGSAEDQYISGQMFIEAYEPKEVRHPYPLILFHGAAQTNACWLSTPDGRMGWADYFISQGYTVYLAEQPARGRSGYFYNDHGALEHFSLGTMADLWLSNKGAWPQSQLHTQWPGDPNSYEDETFHQFASSQVGFIGNGPLLQKMILHACKELLQLTGPAILLTHSQAGQFGWLLADHYRDLIRGIVAVEPMGPPFSPNRDLPVAQNYGLAQQPLHYSPPIHTPSEFQLEFHESHNKNERGGWILCEPAPRLPALAGLPILILTGEASCHAPYDYLTSMVLRQCGVDHDYVRLEQVGIHGNGHMMMLEKNNLEIAAWIHEWLDTRI